MYDSHGAAPPPPLELLNVAMDTPEAPPAPAAETPQPRWRYVLAACAVVLLLGGVVWQQRGTAAAVATPAPVAPAAAEAAPTGIDGFAELFVSTYLTAAGGDRTSAIRRFYPAAPDSIEHTIADRYVTTVAALGVRQTSPGLWEVDVAAEVLRYDGTAYQPDGIHHYLVGVAVADTGLAATSLPARVATAAPAAIPTVVTGTPVEDEALLTLTDGFLRALLTGEGDLRTYVVPGSTLTPTDPPAFTSVAPPDAYTVTTADGALRVRALSIATPESGSPVVVEYHLIVTNAGGSWRVETLAAGPPSLSEMATAETQTQLEDQASMEP